MLHEIPVTSSVVQEVVKQLGVGSNWDEVMEVVQDDLDGIYGDDASPSGQVQAVSLKLITKSRWTKKGALIRGNDRGFSRDAPSLTEAMLDVYDAPRGATFTLKLMIDIGDATESCLVPMSVELNSNGEAIRCLLSAVGLVSEKEKYLTAFLLKYQ